MEDLPLPVNPRATRLESVDMLRGLLMVLMALDHIRDYLSSARVNPVNPADSWPALYLTRWVTHLCAPGFIALAGASIYLQRQRGKTPAQLTRLLVTRGLWLMLLDITLISFGWSFVWDGMLLQVIWCIGACMVLFALVVRLPTCVIAGIGAAIVCLHDLADKLVLHLSGGAATLGDIFFLPNMLAFHGKTFALDIYPILPWFGVMCIGYAFGVVANLPQPAARRGRAALLGAGFLVAFVILRFAFPYANLDSFRHFPEFSRALMSFFNVSKYPPSIDYVLATLGVNLLIYCLFDVLVSRNQLLPARTFFTTYGRVPFFYYVLHIYLCHLTAIGLAIFTHHDWRMWVAPVYVATNNLPPDWGVGLPGVYAAWAFVVLLLFAPCLWFSHVKATRRDWWLSYL